MSEAIHLRLRRETASLHRDLESRLDLLGAGLEAGGYLRTLRAYAGYYAPVEERMNDQVAKRGGLPFGLPERTALLRRDLVALGLPLAAIEGLPRCTAVPRIGALEELAGSLYVLEGASLGGQIIARTLERRLGISPSTGAAFFTGEGVATGRRWRRVIAWIEEVGSATVARDRIVGSARETFETFTRWLECNGVLR